MPASNTHTHWDRHMHKHRTWIGNCSSNFATPLPSRICDACSTWPFRIAHRTSKFRASFLRFRNDIIMKRSCGHNLTTLLPIWIGEVFAARFNCIKEWALEAIACGLAALVQAWICQLCDTCSARPTLGTFVSTACWFEFTAHLRARIGEACHIKLGYKTSRANECCTSHIAARFCIGTSH